MTERINATVLAAHLDLKRTRIRQLVAEGVLRRRSDGSFDRDQSRVPTFAGSEATNAARSSRPPRRGFKMLELAR